MQGEFVPFMYVESDAVGQILLAYAVPKHRNKPAPAAIVKTAPRRLVNFRIFMFLPSDACTEDSRIYRQLIGVAEIKI